MATHVWLKLSLFNKILLQIEQTPCFIRHVVYFVHACSGSVGTESVGGSIGCRFEAYPALKSEIKQHMVLTRTVEPAMVAREKWDLS